MGSELHDRINTIMKQRNEMEGVLTSMTEGVIAVDSDERVLSINRAASEMLGCDSDKVKGQSIQEVVRNPALHTFVTEAVSSDSAVSKDMTLYSTGERIISGHSSALKDAEGKEMGALIVINDITHLRKLENIRRDFAANVSSQLRQAETAMKGVGVQSGYRMATRSPAQVYNYAYGTRGGYGRYGGWRGGYGYRASYDPWASTREDIRQRTQIRDQEKIKGYAQANSIMQNLDAEMGNLRRSLTQKYNIEF